MERLFVVALLVSLCSATSPPFPRIIPLNCNETEFEIGVAMDLINEDREEGFVLRPVRSRSVFQQEAVKGHSRFFYYVDMDVTETDQHVLSGKKWKKCTHDIPIHETVFGRCKAIILISRPWRIYKLLNYNCTIGTLPSSEIRRMCPDCPRLVTDITSDIKAKADQLAEQFNKDSNETHYFKVDHIERVRSQHLFGEFYFFKFTIKETECLKTQPAVNLADCKFLKDHEAHVGYCEGSTIHTPEDKKTSQVSCKIYDPRDDDGHKHCDHGHHRGHKHHRCKYDHPPPHHHHQHHDPDHYNHTKDGSSSKERTDIKPFEKRSKGSVQFYYPSDEQTNVPVPTVVRSPPKYGKYDYIEFPSEPSKLSTCPGKPLVKLPEIVKKHLFV